MTGTRVHVVMDTRPGGTHVAALLPGEKGGGIVRLSYPVDALVSYHYYKRDDLMGAVTGPGHLRLIGDSGAYSAYAQGETIKLAEYARWCLRWRDQLTWVAALDVIGDPHTTWDNWAAFRDTWGISSVPTLHAGGDVKWLDTYAAEGVDFVGLGGLVGGAARGFPWMVHVMRYARDHHPGMRFHAWGVTTRKVLDALPVYSADSSGIMGQAYRYGRMRIFDPASGRDLLITLNGRDPYKHTTLLKRVYGITPAQIARSVPGNRALLIQMAAASTQRYAAWLQARHHVTPPSWGITEPASNGPRVHQVVNRPSHTVPLEPPGGPRIALVDAAAGHGTETDLATLNGPHLHLTDGAVHNLREV